MTPTAATKAATTARTKAKPAEVDTETAAPAAPPAKETDSQKRNRLRNEAERHILNLHKDEFDDYAEELFAKNGLVFNRRLSEAQKAQKKIQDLIALHPELADTLRAQLAPAQHSAVAPVQAEAPVGHSYGDDGPDYAAQEAPAYDVPEQDPFHASYNQ